MKCYKVAPSEHLCLTETHAVWVSSAQGGEVFGLDLETMKTIPDEELIDLMDEMDNVPYEPLEDLDPKILDSILRAKPELRNKVVSWTFETVMDFIFLDAKDKAEKKELKKQIRNEKPLYDWLEKQIGADEKLLDTFQQAVKKKSWNAEAFEDLEQVLRFDKNWKKLLDRTNAYSVKGIMVPIVLDSGQMFPPGLTEEELVGDESDLKDSVNSIIRGFGLGTDIVSKVDVTTDVPPRAVLYTNLAGIFKVVSLLELKYSDIELKF